MALIHEMRASQASVIHEGGTPNPNNTNVFFLTMTRQNLSALLKALQRLEHYWSGASSVATLLEKRECLDQGGFISEDWVLMIGSGLPRSIPRTLPSTLISLPDRGLLRRFTTGQFCSLRSYKS